MERKPDSLTPLLVPTLRLLITLPLTIGLVPLLLTYFFPATMARFVLPLDVTNPSIVPFVIFELIALFLLITPGLPARLGPRFLPLTLFFCSMGPISSLMVRAIEYRIVLPIGATPQELFTFFFQGIWPTAFYVIIPFLVIAWQYPFRYVVIFAIGLALLEVSAPLLLRVRMLHGRSCNSRFNALLSLRQSAISSPSLSPANASSTPPWCWPMRN